ncbi:MAG: GntR family transcriptional regulator [Spirochaetales bacterium]|nr:GntR family transcriptional regulator [Spirochaetales bacterium]
MQTKFQRVTDEIVRRIGEDVWPAGSLIPSEMSLAEVFGVSLITVKRAVNDLIKLGYLNRHQGRRGTFVKENSPEVASRLIGVAIDDVRDRFGAEVLRGIEDYLWDRRFHTLICNGDRNFDKVKDYFHSLLEYNIAGVIFCPVIDNGYLENNKEILDFLKINGLPNVLIDRYVPGTLANYVGANHRESSRQITEYLIAAGHTRIVIAVGIGCTSMDERLQGYIDAFENAGLPVDEKLIIRSNDNLLYRSPDDNELSLLKKQLKECGEFTCFYALNSRLLENGVRVLRAEGYGVGTEISIASHDEPYMDIQMNPAEIPHVVQPVYQMGWGAAQTLLTQIYSPDTPIIQKTLNSKFIKPSAN